MVVRVLLGWGSRLVNLRHADRELPSTEDTTLTHSFPYAEIGSCDGDWRKYGAQGNEIEHHGSANICIDIS